MISHHPRLPGLVGQDKSCVPQLKSLWLSVFIEL